MANDLLLEKRLKMQDLLKQVSGLNNVYFQPPESLKLKYPCLIYRRSHGDVHHADNKAYKQNMLYEIVLIDPDPDSVYIDKLMSIPGMRSDRHYASDNLNHDVFTIYM